MRKRNEILRKLGNESHFKLVGLASLSLTQEEIIRNWQSLDKKICFSLFFEVLGFELRTSRWLGRHSTT